MEKIRPFLKWPGNKFRCIEKILSVLPQGQRLIEPFTGSGAVFMNTSYSSYLLAEANPDLISLYDYLKSQGKDFIDYCAQYFVPANNQAEHYYAFRRSFNETSDKKLRAALMLYLNRHGYNGLCRYNRAGIFNVPFGRINHPYFPATELQSFFQKSQRAEFIYSDFRAIFKLAREGDVIYCDPPYVPLSKTATFTAYNGKTFNMDDQMALAILAREAAEKGIFVIISNHDTPFTRENYQSATIHSFNVPRFISCKGSTRLPARELLAVFTPDKKFAGPDFW